MLEMNNLQQGNTFNNTKKKKKDKNYKKTEIWKLYDNEIIDENKKKVECLYSKNINDIICEVCESELQIHENSLLICSNYKCSIIYKNILDYSAEWRYYGADDSNNCDPTRCGLPINPLLKESNYGCKVLLNGSYNYEIHKIKRYTDWQSMPYKEKALYDEFQKIINIANNNGIPKIIIDEAMRNHKRISEVKTFRGLNRDGIIRFYLYCK